MLHDKMMSFEELEDVCVDAHTGESLGTRLRGSKVTQGKVTRLRDASQHVKLIEVLNDVCTCMYTYLYIELKARSINPQPHSYMCSQQSQLHTPSLCQGQHHECTCTL